MSKHKKQEDDYWDEILDSVDMDFLPVEYVSMIIVKFTDGKIWEIDLLKQKKDQDELDEILEQFFEEYEDSIENVDFRLNIDKLKQDISKRTRRFLKLNK